jgi:pimeloyl-ACP methyl ester carboxylesterase
MRPLARIAGAKVLAFDRPAFGLTSRAGWSGDDTKPLNPYSMAFSVMATLAFIDQLGTGKAVLVGYSLIDAHSALHSSASVHCWFI